MQQLSTDSFSDFSPAPSLLQSVFERQTESESFADPLEALLSDEAVVQCRAFDQTLI